MKRLVLHVHLYTHACFKDVRSYVVAVRRLDNNIATKLICVKSLNAMDTSWIWIAKHFFLLLNECKKFLILVMVIPVLVVIIVYNLSLL